MATSTEYQNLTLLQFAELLEQATSPDVPTWVREFYWTAVEADKGDKEAIRTLLVAVATNTDRALKLKEFEAALDEREFDGDGNKYYRAGQEDMRDAIQDYLSDEEH